MDVLEDLDSWDYILEAIIEGERPYLHMPITGTAEEYDNLPHQGVPSPLQGCCREIAG